MFKPRPGWGGRLRLWVQHNCYMFIFRMLILIAAIFIGSSLIHSWQVAQIAKTVIPFPTATPQVAYELIAAHGVGMTQLASRVLDSYLTDRSIHLDRAQHLFAVDALARHAGWRQLASGERVSFDLDTLAQITISAKSLTATQHAAWARIR
jgi:hypothetical protein